MEKYWAILKVFARGLPYFTLLTAIVYVAGKDFHSHYWQGLGLPLMAMDRSVADMLYDGFLGYALLASLLLRIKVDPVAVIVIFPILAALTFRFVEYLVERLELWVKRRLAAKKRRDSRLRRLTGKVFDEVVRVAGYVNFITGPLVGAALFICLAVLIAFVPAMAVANRGLAQGARDRDMYESRIRQLRDGLVDVSAVTVRRTGGDNLESGVPIACAGDRCAAMMEDGPISLPKERFIEEYLVRAVWTGDCLTPEGLHKREIAMAKGRDI